ncbi:uro-adherence factor A-like [Palaemon carinicauda]|uniref:uro-adherence factor A-like n=1 Tax=Palaemon carinicauda TaxID=392227 RepID=UPI0035B580E2
MPFSVLDLGAGRLPTSKFQDFHLQFAVQDVKNNKLKNLRNSIKTLFMDEKVLFQMNTSKSEMESLYWEDVKVINFNGIKLCKTPYTNYNFLKEFISELCEPNYSLHENIQESVSHVRNAYFQEVYQHSEVTEAAQDMCGNSLKFCNGITNSIGSKMTCSSLDSSLTQINMLNSENDKSTVILKKQRNENNKHQSLSNKYLWGIDEFHITVDQMQLSGKKSSLLVSEGNKESKPVSMLEEMSQSKSVLAMAGKSKNHVKPLSISELNDTMSIDGNENSRLMAISEENNGSEFLSISQGNNDLRSLPSSGNNWKSFAVFEGNDDKFEELNNNSKTFTDNVYNLDNFSNSVENEIHTRLDISKSNCLKDNVDITSCISIPAVVKSEQQQESDVPVVNGMCCDAPPQCIETDMFFEKGQQEELYHEQHSDFKRKNSNLLHEEATEGFPSSRRNGISCSSHEQHSDFKWKDSNLLHGKATESSSQLKLNEIPGPAKFSLELQMDSTFDTLKNGMEGVLSENNPQYSIQAGNEKIFKGPKDSSQLYYLHAKNFDLRNSRQEMSDEVEVREMTKLKEKSSQEMKAEKLFQEKYLYSSNNTASQINPSHCNTSTRLPSRKPKLRRRFSGRGNRYETSAGEEHRRLASKEEVNVSSHANVKLNIGSVSEKEPSQGENKRKEFKTDKIDSLGEPLSPEIPLLSSVASRLGENTKMTTSSVERSNGGTHNEVYIVVDEIDSSEALTDTEEVKDIASEEETIYPRDPGRLRVTETKHTRNAEEPIKSYMQPFESSNPLENRDNEDPKWNYLKHLATDEARYQFSRSRWKSLVVPDPNKNFTLFSYRCRQKTHAEAQKSSRKRMLSIKEQNEGRPPNKRVCRLNHNFSDHVFDESIASVRYEYFNHIKKTAQTRRKLYEKLHMLEVAKSEVRVINRFYMGLPDQDLSVSQDILEQEQVDSNELFKKFKNIYKWNGRLFVP